MTPPPPPPTGSRVDKGAEADSPVFTGFRITADYFQIVKHEDLLLLSAPIILELDCSDCSLTRVVLGALLVTATASQWALCEVTPARRFEG